MVILDEFYEGDERFKCALHKDCGYLVQDNEKTVIGNIDILWFMYMIVSGKSKSKILVRDN